MTDPYPKWTEFLKKHPSICQSYCYLPAKDPNLEGYCRKLKDNVLFQACSQCTGTPDPALEKEPTAPFYFQKKAKKKSTFFGI